MKSVVRVTGLLSFWLILSGNTCSSTDNRPTLESRFPNKWDICLESIDLRYDLTDNVNLFEQLYSTSLNSDLQELQDIHYITRGKGSIRTLFDILTNAGQVFSEDSKPEVSFCFQHPDCSAPLTISSNDSSVAASFCRDSIKNAPRITANHIVQYSIKTMCTSSKRLQIKWENSLDIRGQSPGILISKDGKPTTMYGILATKTQPTSPHSSDGVNVAINVDPLQPIGDDGASSNNQNLEFSFVENTVGDSVESGFYFLDFQGDSLFFSPILSQQIYKGGEYCSNIIWDSPLSASLVPVESAPDSLLQNPGQIFLIGIE